MMPSAPAMVSPPMIPGRNAATTPPNTKNSKTMTSGIASTSARCWSVAMVPGQFVGQRQQTGQLHVDARVGEIGLDRFEVLQDEVVVVALELDGHERVLLGRVGHVAQHVGGLEIADGPHDLVRVVLLDLREVVEDLLPEGRVVDGLAVGSGVDRDDMAGGVPAVVLVAEARRLRRLAAVVEEATLGDVLPQAAAVDARTEAQRHHDCDHDESVAVYRSTPPGEND